MHFLLPLFFFYLAYLFNDISHSMHFFYCALFSIISLFRIRHFYFIIALPFLFIIYALECT